MIRLRNVLPEPATMESYMDGNSQRYERWAKMYSI